MTEPANDRVDDNETLLRRIPDLGRADFSPVDLATEERRLSSGAFTPDDDGISLYREALPSRAGLKARAVVRHPLNAVACLPTLAVRGMKLDVVPDPQPATSADPDFRLGMTHALIVGFASPASRGRRGAGDGTRASAVDGAQSVEIVLVGRPVDEPVSCPPDQCPSTVGGGHAGVDLVSRCFLRL